MATCSDTILTENIDFCADQENAAGVSSVEIFACRVQDFLTIAEPPALGTAVSLAEAATIATAHTFAVGKGFFKINVLPHTGLVDFEPQGEPGSKTNVNSFSGTLPGISARNKGFIRKYQNIGMIFIVTQITGEKVQIGSKVSPAYLTEAPGTSGQKPGDVSGISVKFSDTQAYPAPTYASTITEFTPPV